jgi:MFS family permease
MFSALRHRNYRLWATGLLVSHTGTWMQRIAQDWLILTVLTDHSAVAVGAATGLQFAPMVLLAMPAAAVADRVSKRRLLAVTQALMGTFALTLGILVLTGAVQLWHVLGLSCCLGVTAAFDTPSRQAFASELVPAPVVPNAVSLNSGLFNIGRLFGPAVAGLTIAAVGLVPAFLINAASFGAVLLALGAMRGGDLWRLPPARAAGGRRVRDAVRYVLGDRRLRLLVTLLVTICTFGLNFQVATVLMATTVFRRGAAEYGLLGSVLAVGALTGALFAAHWAVPDMRRVVGAAFCFGACATTAAWMPTYETFALLLAPVGFCATVVGTTSNTTLQLSTPPGMRARVVAIYVAVNQGGNAWGAPAIGWIAAVFNARWALALGGVSALVVAVAVGLRLRLLAGAASPSPAGGASPSPAGGASPSPADLGSAGVAGGDAEGLHHGGDAGVPGTRHRHEDVIR